MIPLCWSDGKNLTDYCFQDDKYIDKVEKVETYNRVLAEQTDEDKEKFVEQQKKVAKFRKYVKDNAIKKVGVSTTPIEGREERGEGRENSPALELEAPKVELPPPVAEAPDDLLRRALEDL